MNDVGRLHASVGMTNLTDPGNTTDNPINGTTKSTGWHLYWDASYSDNPNDSNAWVAQIVNKAGTDQWWVRSRSGGTITNGTAWHSGWRHLITADQAGVGSATKPVYINANGEVQATTYSFNANINGGVANRIAYYSSVNAIDSGSITTDGSYLGAVSYLSINTAHQTGYRLYVNGTSYLNGAVSFANNTWNKIGDDAQLGDINLGGHIGIQGLNGNTGIFFTTYNQSTKTTGGNLTWDGTKFIFSNLVAISTNNNTLTIGSQNTSYSHIENSADIPFYFNKGIYVDGFMKPYSNNNRDLGDASHRWASLHIYRNVNIYGNESTGDENHIKFNASDNSQRAIITFNGNTDNTANSTTHLKIATSYGDIRLNAASKNISIGDGNNALLYRTSTATRAGIYYHTSGRESVVFANKYGHASWIFVNNIDPAEKKQWNSLGTTPAVQIHHNALYINRAVRDSDTADFNFYVNGTSYLNGQVSVKTLSGLEGGHVILFCKNNIVSTSTPKVGTTTNLTTSDSDAEWLKATLKAICATYPNYSSVVFKGKIAPNSEGYYEVCIYNTDTVDSNGLPRYSYGTFRKYTGNYYVFGTSDYSYYCTSIVQNSGTWNISITGNANTATALTSNAGGTEQPIYFSGGKPVATSYALKATVNAGTASRIAYYSGDRAISSGGITTDGNYLGAVSYLSVNTAHQTSYRLSVNGAGLINNNLTVGTSNAGGFGLAQTNGTGLGIALYGGPRATIPEYGLAFALTGNQGKWGDVQADWATYFTMNTNNQRGWIWKAYNSTAETAMAGALSSRGVFTARAVGNNEVFIAFPQGGTYHTQTPTVTGALKITLPQFKSNTMMQFDINIYMYEGDNRMSATYTVGGYLYGDSGWYANSSRAYSTGIGPNKNLTVRFGYDGSKACVMIGEVNTTWNYPQVSVSNITYGYSNYGINSFGYGWTISFITTLPTTISGSITNPAIYKDGTANRIAWFNTATQISSGSITTDGGYLGNVSYLSINTAHQTGYRLYVNGDSYISGWSRAANGFYVHDTGVHYTHQGNFGEINTTKGNELIFSGNNATGYINYRAASRGTTYTTWVWNAGSSSSYATHKIGHLHNGANNTYDIGATGTRWRTGYFQTSLLIGGTSYTAGNSAAAGSFFGQGYIEMSSSTPFIDFHQNHSTADFTSRIIANAANRLEFDRGGTPANLSYNSRTITPMVFFNGNPVYTNSDFEAAGHFMNNRPSSGGGYYLYGNNVEYGHFYISTIGTANSGDGNATRGAQGEVYLNVGNSITRPAAGTAGGANNARGRIHVYGTGGGYTRIMDGEWYGNNLTVVSGGSTTANTEHLSYVIAGNSANVASTASHTEGVLRLYSAATHYHQIRGRSTTTNYTHYLPNQNSWIAVGGNGSNTGVGSTTQPVYLSADGILSTTTYSLSATISGGTASRIAYYSAAHTISSGSIVTDGGYLGSVSYLSVNTAHQTGYRAYINGTTYFNGNTTHNGIAYFANGTTYYINNSGDSRLRYLGVGSAAPSTSYALNIGGNVFLNGIHYFGNGTTYYINNSAVGYFPDFRVDQVRLDSNWIGFYQSNNAGGNRYGYVQADASYMYFRKENGNSGFNFNGNLIPSATNSFDLGTSANRWRTLYMQGNIVMQDMGTPASYPATANKITWSGGTDGAELYYQVDSADNGRFFINMKDDGSALIALAYGGSAKAYFNPSTPSFYPVTNKTGQIGLSSNKWKHLYVDNINQALTGGTRTTAGGDHGSSANPRYFPDVWTFNAAITPANGDMITIETPGPGHDYGVFLSTDNGTNYYPITLSGTGRLTTHYPQGTFLVLVFDSDNSAGSMFARAGQNNTTRATVSGGTWRVVNYYADGNPGDWNLRQYTIKAAAAIRATHVIGGTDAGYKEVAAGNAFDIRYTVLFAGSAISSGATSSNNYIHHYSVNIHNNSNSNISGWTAYKNLYIKGTISGTTFTPISGGSPFVQDITAADDGYVYYYIGRAYNSNAMTFDTTGKIIYWYKENKVQIYTGNIYANDITTGAPEADLFSELQYNNMITTVTLVSSDWSASAPYTQTVSVNGMRASANPFFWLADTNSAAVANAFYYIDIMTTANGSVTFKCLSSKPTVNVPIIIKGR